ncbi:hypothetical protein N7527_009068 [Penicillium freii]|nr:hypothetical protein N7527_009068 [Penicillium freii]
MAARATLSHEDYTVGWICALPLEMAAAKLMLDAIHPSLPRSPTDQNTYILGNIGDHNVVIACLPSGAYGIVSAATVAMQLLSSFHSIRFGLMVGIGGGVPNGNADIRLGDIVVSQPTDTSGGVIQYDLVIRGICDYADSHKNKEWQGYAAVAAAAYAKELVLVVPNDQVKTTPTARDTLADPIHRFDVPLDLTAVPVIANFVGRQDELDNLWQDDFTAIFWLHGKDRDALLQSLSFALNRLLGQGSDSEASNDTDVEQQARHMLRWLELDGNSRWLIIFDNIDQYSPSHGADFDGYDIREFFPKADHGSILVTSRLQRLTELGEPFPVDRLDSYNSIQLLLRSSGLSARSTNSKLDKNPDILTLANRLDGLPLAIVIAGAFMRETGTSITEYLQHYQESWSELQLQSNPGRQYQQGNMLQTWMISYLKIQERDPSAADLLLLLAHFDSRDIWYELVKSGRHSSNVPVWLEKAISGRLSFKVCMRSLVGFSFLQSTQQEGSYTMHPVVQDWCLYVANESNDVNRMQLNELAVISVGYSVPSASDRGYLELQQRLLPHAKYVCHFDWSDDDIELWGAFHGLGDLYSDQSKLKEAEDMYHRALAGREKFLGPDHTSTLDTVNNLGNLYSDQAKLQEAEEMYLRALAGYKRALGSDHMSTLNTVNNLGLLYSYQGKLKEAEEMYRQALAGKEKALDPDHISTLDTINNLGLLYSDQGKLKEAEEMYQQALAGYERALGPDHTSTLDIFNNLANLYKDQKDLKGAEEMYQRALAGKEKALGPDHTSTLVTVNNLGSLYFDQGRLKEAEEMYQRALVGKEKALGPDHTSTLITVNNLRSLCKDQGKLKEAEEMYQRALAGYEKAFGPDHISTLMTVNSLGTLYKDQGKLKEAEEMYRRALAGYKKALGLDHTSTLNTINNLGLLYSYQGKLKEAEDMYQRALEGYEKAFGPDHTSTLMVVNNIGLLYFDQGKLKEQKRCTSEH